MKERDLTYDLGKKNWIDAIAGEAVVLGMSIRNPQLEAAGTELARLVREIPYDSDRFALVIANARGLVEAIDRAIRERQQTTYIDTVFKGESVAKKDRWSWEFNLIFATGRYEIQMILPVYAGNAILLAEKKKKAEMVVCSFFRDPEFETYNRSDVNLDHGSQQYRTTSYRDSETGKLLRVITDHDHEGYAYRGWYEVFYFDDFETARSAWEKMRSIVA